MEGIWEGLVAKVLDTSLEGTHLYGQDGSLQKGKDGPHIPYAPCMEYLPTFARKKSTCFVGKSTSTIFRKTGHEK